MRLRETAPWLAVLALGLACFFAWRWLSGEMFSRNPQYALRRVEIAPGYAKTEQEIRDITGLREGVNLFSFRASEVRERLLRTTPNIADVEVSKRLPDAVSLVVHDRVPAAKLCSPRLALDADGFVFTILPRDAERYRSIPLIENGSEPWRPDAGRTLSGTPGTPTGVEARVMRALRVATLCERVFGHDAANPLRLRVLDVSNSTYLTMLTEDNRFVRLVWEEIPDDESILQGLALADETLRDPAARGKKQFDVILSAGKVFVG